MRHVLKTWPPFFQHVASGVKPFEVRKDDRSFAVGDVLHLREWDPYTSAYTDRFDERTVTYVLRGGEFGIEAGYVVLGLK